MLNLKLEKVIALFQASNVVLAVDAFNITKSAQDSERQNLINAPDHGQDKRIFNPRVNRLGARSSFLAIWGTGLFLELQREPLFMLSN